MTDEAPTPGPMEERYRLWILDLAPLNHRQEAIAQVVIALAVQMDLATMLARNHQEPTSAVATWARAILLATRDLRATDPSQVPVPVPIPVPARQDRNDIARKRAERLRKAT